MKERIPHLDDLLMTRKNGSINGEDNYLALNNINIPFSVE